MMHSNRSSPLYLSFAILALLAVSCSKSSEAVTRQDQETMFTELMGFEPTKSIVEIKYKEVYNRHIANGAWGRWLRFTYSDDVFSKIVKEPGYKQREEFHSVAIESDAAPKWWPKIDHSKTTIYLRSHKDTPQKKGYSFEEYLWRDTNSNFVYYHKRYWN